LVFVLVLACAAQPARVELPPPFAHEDDEEDDPRAERPAPTSLPTPAKPLPRAQGLSRSELGAVLDQGPGVFLQGVRVRPTFLGKRWGGWEIVTFWPGDERFRDVDLAPGDVIETVNGMRLERPEELWELWDSLRRAPALTVVYLRRGEAHTLSFPIAD
jgi:type II secretory pathway component PulC